MRNVSLKNFNHEITLVGGQSFSWDLVGDNEYVGVLQDDVIRAKFDESNGNLSYSSLKGDDDFIKEYFRIDTDYAKILEQISRDEHVKSAIAWQPNVRILKQPFEQTVLSYVLSSNNSILRINKSIRMLSKMLGDKVKFEGEEYSLFPSAEVLADASEELLFSAKIGYRNKFLKQVAQRLVDSQLAAHYQELSEEELRKELIAMPGIGEKVADCVMVFAVGVDDITPVDVWVKRFLKNLYGVSENLKPEEYRAWLRDQFGGYAAWAGQFLFEWYRRNYRK